MFSPADYLTFPQGDARVCGFATGIFTRQVQQVFHVGEGFGFVGLTHEFDYAAAANTDLQAVQVGPIALGEAWAFGRGAPNVEGKAERTSAGNDEQQGDDDCFFHMYRLLMKQTASLLYLCLFDSSGVYLIGKRKAIVCSFFSCFCAVAVYSARTSLWIFRGVYGQ